MSSDTNSKVRYPRHAQHALDKSEKQGGLTGPGNPLIADAVTVDINTPIGDADFSATLPSNNGKSKYILYLLGGMVVAYFVLRQ